jgi:hypothetical protein
MGGFAPRLRSLHLNRIPFPGLAKLLSSANGLMHLLLSNIPHAGYVSPDALATCLSAQTSLKDLAFELATCYSYSNQPLLVYDVLVLGSIIMADRGQASNDGPNNT